MHTNLVMILMTLFSVAEAEQYLNGDGETRVLTNFFSSSPDTDPNHQILYCEFEEGHSTETCNHPRYLTACYSRILDVNMKSFKVSPSGLNFCADEKDGDVQSFAEKWWNKTDAALSGRPGHFRDAPQNSKLYLPLSDGHQQEVGFLTVHCASRLNDGGAAFAHYDECMRFTSGLHLDVKTSTINILLK